MGLSTEDVRVSLQNNCEIQRNKNLNFFKEYYPQLYHVFKSFVAKTSQLVVGSSGEFDIVENGNRLYLGNYSKTVTSEVAEFSQAFSSRRKFASVNAPGKDMYACPRYSQRILNDVISKSPLAESGKKDIYRVPDEYPLLVFMGCGLAGHIGQTLDKRKAQHVIIFERNIEHLFLSLFVTDWASICQPFIDNSERTLQFLVSGSYDIETNWKLLWNELIRYYPFFPVATFYFNHLGFDGMAAISEKIDSEIPAIMHSWGHFDDEINQLNNAIHNMERAPTFLSCLSLDAYKDWPVLIVGSGPSLDEYIDLIKAYREKVVVISCGSSLCALIKNGIKPDFHFSLESDYLENELLGEVGSESNLDQTLLIGALQVNPHVFRSEFENSLVFAKVEGLVGGLCDPSIGRIENAGPTCTNTAYVVASKLGFNNIYLVGMDFGFKDQERHHAKDTVYYKTDQSDSLKEMSSFDKRDLLTLPGVDGSTVWCLPYYYIAKGRLEVAIENCEGKLSIQNTSNGAEIAGAPKVDLESFKSQADRWIVIDRGQLRKELVSNSVSHTSSHNVQFDTNLKILKDTVYNYTDGISQVLNEIKITDDKSHIALISTIRNRVEVFKKKMHPSIDSLVNGTVKHFLYVGLTHTLSIEDPKLKDQFIEDWKLGFLEFLSGVNLELEKKLNNRSSFEEDIWLKKSISDAVD